VLLAYLAALATALCYGLGSVLQSMGAKRVQSKPGVSLGSLSRILRQGPYVLGLGLDGLGWLASLLALLRLPLFVVQAMVAGSIAFIVLFSALLEKAKPSGRQLAYVAVLCLGLLALAASGAPEVATRPPGYFVPAMAATACVLLFAGFVTPKLLSPVAASSVLGAVAGLAFGGAALCVRSLSSGIKPSEILHPTLWILLAFGGMGMAFFATALQRGAVTVTTAWLFTAETIAPALIGMLLLGDRARPGLGFVAAASFVLTVAASVGLSLSSRESTKETA